MRVLCNEITQQVQRCVARAVHHRMLAESSNQPLRDDRDFCQPHGLDTASSANVGSEGLIHGFIGILRQRAAATQAFQGGADDGRSIACVRRSRAAHSFLGAVILGVCRAALSCCNAFKCGGGCQCSGVASFERGERHFAENYLRQRTLFDGAAPAVRMFEHRSFTAALPKLHECSHKYRVAR
eukprot:7389650-Prymnesium_polylepis.1